MNTFNINLERYSGPYNKILELIEDRKLSINEFSLAAITDDYIYFIKSLEEKNLSEKKIDISEFIVIASTLMLIKAKSLFPNVSYTEEEKGEVLNLENKLALYKVMSEASKNINKNFAKDKFTLLPEQENKENVFVFDKRLDKIFLHSVAIATILKFPKIEKIKQVSVKQVLKIEDVIEKLLNRINIASTMNFKDFSENLGQTFKTIDERRNAFIVSFLAMLELIKNGRLHANQDANNHNEINIFKQDKQND